MAPTRKLEQDRPSRARGRGRLALGGALLAVVLIVVAILVLGGSDGGGDGGPGTASGAGAAQSTAKEKAPETLSAEQLIAEADAICTESQSGYLEVRDLESEHSADIPYAETLVRLAKTRIEGLRELTPPARLAGPYGEYVKAQERVYATDKQALAAAREGDDAGVQVAREERDSEDLLREELAREIGFNACSTSKG